MTFQRVQGGKSSSTRKQEVGRDACIERFDVSTVDGFPFILVYGRRCTGKSVMTMTLVKQFKHFPAGVVMCVSEGSSASDYSRHFPSRFIYETTSPHVLEDLVESQRRVKANLRAQGRSWNDPDVIRRVRKLVVIDDGAYDEKLMNSEVLRLLAVAGRHMYIAVIITAQQIGMIPPKVRSQFDYLFATEINSAKEFRNINEEFLDTVQHKPSVWRKITKACTRGYWSFVIRMNSNADIMQRIFYMDPPPDQGDFRFGSQGFWDMDALAEREKRMQAERAVAEKGASKKPGDADEAYRRGPEAIVVSI